MWKRNRNNYNEAKKIFIKYNGSHFQMERELEYNKYKSYQVPKKMEKNWINEVEKKFFNKLKIESNESTIVDILMNLEQIIVQYKDENGLSLIVNYANKNIIKFDTFTKLIIAETILDIVSELKLKGNQIDTAEFAINILNDVIKNPIKISQDHLENGEIPNYMFSEVLVERAKKDIENWNSSI